jgi:cytochrome c-type biogenesis protein CcmF
MPKRLLATVLAVQVQHRDRLSRPSSLLTSNPFARVIPAAVRGQGAEPASCRIPGLAIHPPLLYLGYVGFSIAFSFAIGRAH